MREKWVIWVGCIIFVIVALGFALSVGSSFMGFTSHRVFLSATITGVGIVTFFSFVWHAIERDGTLREAGMRNAITASILTVYLVFFGIVSFSVGGRNELPILTETMLSSFTAIVAIIVPFYFGASAYVEIKKRQLEKDNSTESEEDGQRKRDENWV